MALFSLYLVKLNRSEKTLVAGDFSESEDSKEDDSQSLIVEKESHWAKYFLCGRRRPTACRCCCLDSPPDLGSPSYCSLVVRLPLEDQSLVLF